MPAAAQFLFSISAPDALLSECSSIIKQTFANQHNQDNLQDGCPEASTPGRFQTLSITGVKGILEESYSSSGTLISRQRILALYQVCSVPLLFHLCPQPRGCCQHLLSRSSSSVYSPLKCLHRYAREVRTMFWVILTCSSQQGLTSTIIKQPQIQRFCPHRSAVTFRDLWLAV